MKFKKSPSYVFVANHDLARCDGDRLRESGEPAREHLPHSAILPQDDFVPCANTFLSKFSLSQDDFMLYGIIYCS